MNEKFDFIDAVMNQIKMKAQNSVMRKLIDLFKALIRNGLKISPKKCQLFRKKLVYMRHTLLIEDGIPTINPPDIWLIFSLLFLKASSQYEVIGPLDEVWLAMVASSLQNYTWGLN